MRSRKKLSEGIFMIEFRTKFDSSKTNAVNKNTFKRFAWAFVLFSAIFIAIGIAEIAVGDAEDLSYGIFLLVVGVLFMPLVWVLTKIIQRSLDRSMSIMSSETEEIYTFEEDYIKIDSRRGDEYHGFTEAKYTYLYRVIENDKFYFLYISKAQCHVVDKASLTVGTLVELNSLLRAQLGPKFKSKSK